MQPGQILSRKYLLVRRLAEGGMGEVWLARNERTQGQCAIKVLLPELARNPEALRRFVREARATGRLEHPGIIQVFDAGKTDDGRPYLTMELLTGESLGDCLRRETQISPAETCVLMSQVARAAHHAHQHGVVHRDLSTGNVFLVRSQEGAPTTKILDFGVSKVTESGANTLTGTLLGSPAYMSPEQAEGADQVDARTDIWSVGVLTYQCLCGQLPFRGRNHTSTMLAVLSKPHEPLIELIPDLDPELSAVVEGCLIKDREERIQTAAEVAEALERIARRLMRAGASFTPRRRLSDRLPAESSRRRLRTPRDPRALWLASGTGAMGLLLGLLIGVSVTAPNEPLRSNISSSRATPEAAPVAVIGSRAEPDDVLSIEALPRADEGDLATAVADELGVERR